MNPFFQSDSVGEMPISPHSLRKAPINSPYALVPHKRANGQPGMISNKKPREVQHDSQTQNAAALLQYWQYAAGPYHLAQSIAQMDMVTPMSPISPIRQPSTPLSPFGAPGIMYSHASPLPYYAQNYMAFHPGFAALPGSMMPYLRVNDYPTAGHVPMTPPAAPFGSPLTNHSLALSNIYDNEQSTASSYRIPQSPSIHKSPLSYKREDPSTTNVMPRFNEAADLNIDDTIVLPGYSHLTPIINNQQEGMFTDGPESSKGEAFHTSPSTPKIAVYECTGRQDARRQRYQKNKSTPVSAVSPKPVSTTSFVSNWVEYTMKDFGVEPREIWPTDSPSLTSNQIGRSDVHPPFSAPIGKMVTASASSAEGTADIIVTKVIPSRNPCASPFTKGQSQSVPKLESCWSTGEEFEANKENIPPVTLLNRNQEAVFTASLEPPPSNTLQRALEHLGTFEPRTIPKTPYFLMNPSSLGLDAAGRSALEPSMEMISDSTRVRVLPTGTAAPDFQNPVNSGKSTSGSTGTPSCKSSNDSARVVPMVQRNWSTLATTSFKWSPVSKLSQ